MPPAASDPDPDESAPAASQAGRKKGVGNYKTAETKHLLDIMEKILPIGPDEWDRVLAEHDELYPCRRSVESLRRRFQNLHRKHAPSGSPNIPDDVRQARTIKALIGRKADICNGEAQEFTLEEGFGPSTDPIPPQPSPPTQPTQLTQPTQETLTQETLTHVEPTQSQTYNSTITPSSKRSYNSRSNTPTGEFFQAFQLQLQQDRM